MEKIKAYLSPTPSITAKETIEFDGKIVGFIRVERHENRPVIIYRDGDGLNEGEILFRYPGQSSRIKFGDLRAMLEERDRRTQIALADAAGRMANIGTANALIIDTEKNILDVQGRPILIDEHLAKSINLVKEGRFDSKTGTPALKLAGEVASLSQRVVREAIFQEEILDDFLNQRSVEQPLQYIRATLAQSKLWLPIFYFARMSGRTNAEIAMEISRMKVSQKGKKKVLIDRLEGRKSALTKAVTQSARNLCLRLSHGELSIPSAAEDVAIFAQAMTAITTTTLAINELFPALISCRDLAESAGNSSALGAVYKAACRVDELFFRG